MQTIQPAARPDTTSHQAIAAISLIATLVVIADALFYGHPIGISLGLFLLLVAAAIVGGNRLAATRGQAALAALTLTVGLLPLVEAVSILSVASGLAGLAASPSSSPETPIRAGPSRFRRAATLLFGDPHGTGRLLSAGVPAGAAAGLGRVTVGLAAWLLPLGFGLVFVALFSFANPNLLVLG